MPLTVRRPVSHRLRNNLRYLWTLLRRFRTTFLLLLLVQLGGSVALWVGQRWLAHPISFPKAMGATYFLLLGQPAMELPDSYLMMTIVALFPVFGLAVVADGLVRFGYLFFAKHRNDKEWIAVVAETFKNHVVLCGAGRVGFRVLEQLRKLGLDVVVVERNEHAPFVQSIRNMKVPLLVDDVRAADALESTHIRAARAIVCATDDDLANLNIALDARRLNPKIRVVLRLFDEDLVHKVKDAFVVEALSTSALAAPAFAAAALDPTVRACFELAGELMVVAEMQVGPQLAGKSLAELQDAEHLRILKIARGEGAWEEVPSSTKLAGGERVLVQASYVRYDRLRAREAAAAA